MELKQLFDDDNAVSPVIGVILMVAITVILAAVIGAFVLNLGGSQDAAPTATWQWDNSTSGVEITMKSGTDVQAEEIYLQVDTKSGNTTAVSNTGKWGGSGTIGAGDTQTLVNDTGSVDWFEPGNEFSIVWKSSTTDSSTVLDEYTTPS